MFIISTKNELTKEIINEFESIGVNTNTRYFKRHYRNGFLNDIDMDYVNEVQNFYKKHYGRNVDPVTHLAIKGMTGIKDKNIIPEQIFRSVLLPFFNDRGMIDGNMDKNTYDILFSSFKQAHTVLKRVRGHYLVKKTEHIDRSEVEKKLLNDSPEYIIKASDTNNGVGINKLKVINNTLSINNQNVSLKDIESEYGYNFLVQRVIKQHKVMSEPHPSSVNTLRMVTLRWNNKIHNVYTFSRIGVNNAVKDYVADGGLTIGVKEDGSFMPFGLSSYKKVAFHPSNDFPLESLGHIPNFDEFLSFTRDLHKSIIHHDYVSWDIAVGEDGKPVLIEANFFGTCFAAQVALKRSLFGDNTKDILEDIRDNKKYNKERNLKIRSSSKLKRRIKRLKTNNQDLISKNKGLRSTNKRLEKNNDDYMNEISNLKATISDMQNSKSWRYTRVFRKKKK